MQSTHAHAHAHAHARTRTRTHTHTRTHVPMSVRAKRGNAALQSAHVQLCGDAKMARSMDATAALWSSTTLSTSCRSVKHSIMALRRGLAHPQHTHAHAHGHTRTHAHTRMHTNIKQHLTHQQFMSLRARALVFFLSAPLHLCCTVISALV